MEKVLADIRSKRTLQVDQALQLFEILKISDLASQRGTLNLIQKKLNDKKVYDMWCKTLSESWAEPLSLPLLSVLKQHLYCGGVPTDWQTPLLAQMNWLVSAMSNASLRSHALEVLQMIVASSPVSVTTVVSAWGQVEKNAQKDEFLRHLFTVRHQWVGAADFFAKIIIEDPLAIHEDWREYVVAFLLEKNKLDIDQQIKFLRGNETEEVRIVVLTHWLSQNDSYDPRKVEITKQLMRGDPSDWIGLQAISYLSLNLQHEPQLADDLLMKLRNSKDEWQRTYLKEALQAAYSYQSQKEVFVQNIGKLIKDVGNDDLSITCIELLKPYLTLNDESSKAIVGILVEQLQGNTSEKIFVEVLTTLEHVIHQNVHAVDFILYHLKTNTSDRCVAQIIDMLSHLSNLNEVQDVSLREWVKGAMTSPQPEIREAALTYMINVRLIPEVYELLLHGCDLLLDTSISLFVRKEFGKKLAKLPAVTGAGKTKLEKVLTTLSTSDFNYVHGELTQLLTRVNTATESRDGEPDWSEWLDRIQNKKPIDGIVPAIYIHYDKNPAKALSVLKSMFFNNVYGWPRLANPSNILMFFLAKNAIDLEIANDAFHFLITKDDAWGSMNYHLMLLKNFKELPQHKEQVWLVFEREGNHKRVNSALLREVLCYASGGDDKVYEEMKRRMSQKTNASDLTPYLHFFAENASWAYSKQLVEGLDDLFFDKPVLEENGNRDIVTDLRLKLKIDSLRPGLKAEPVKQAGLLDE